MLAIMHWWLSNVGLAAMVVGFALRAHGRAPHTMLLGIGGTMFASGAFLFVFNMWRTFDLADKRHRARSTSGEARRGLPTME
jgi:cbb3-type cytochrome oxidase subunit 1